MFSIYFMRNVYIKYNLYNTYINLNSCNSLMLCFLFLSAICLCMLHMLPLFTWKCRRASAAQGPNNGYIFMLLILLLLNLLEIFGT